MDKGMSELRQAHLRADPSVVFWKTIIPADAKFQSPQKNATVLVRLKGVDNDLGEPHSFPAFTLQS